METNDRDFDEARSEHDALGVAPVLQVADAVLQGAAFIIPLDAPLPNELNTPSVPQGGLLSRIRFLDEGVNPDDGFPFVPLSGHEFMSLERCWHGLCTRKLIYVLLDLPGVRTDVLFDTARRVIGIRSLEWPQVRDAMMAYTVEKQRLKDTKPWVDIPTTPGVHASPRGRRGLNFSTKPPAADVPDNVADGADDDETA